MRCNSASNLGCANRQGWHWQAPKTRFVRLWSGKLSLCFSPVSAISYTNYSGLHNLLPSVPAWQRPRLVFTQQQEQFGVRPFALQLAQGVNGVAWAGAFGFARINQHLGQIGKGEPRHRQPVRCRAQGSRLVPGLTGGDDTQFIELQFRQRCLRQCHMGCVRRIKSAAKHGNAPAPLRARRHLHLRPSPGAPGTWRTARLQANRLRGPAGRTSSPAAASTTESIRCARPIAGRSACPGPRPG